MKNDNKIAFEKEYKGFKVTAYYLDEEYPDAKIVIERDGKPFTEYLYPSYKIWNIAAHFTDMVDGELEKEKLTEFDDIS